MKLKEWINKHPREQRAEVRKRLGEAVGVSEITIRSMANGNRPIKGEYVLAIARATDNEVKPHDVRPDLYPRKLYA